MNFLKAFIPGFILTFVVAGILGSQGTRGGIMAIERIAFEGHTFYWSWFLFAAATGLAWGILVLMDS